MHFSDYIRLCLQTCYLSIHFVSFPLGIVGYLCVSLGHTHPWWSYRCRGNMGTQGSGRKRAPLKDRFSAEDEALSSIAREVRPRSTT